MRTSVGRARARRDDGYTLTEILVVMAVIGLIAAALTPGLVGQLGRSRLKTAQVQVETVAAAVEMFRADVGRYPTESEGLAVLINQPGDVEGWTGPYVKSERTLSDPWGNRMDYALGDDGRNFLVTSFGADGQEAGEGQNRDVSAPANR
ncbi:MAG: type II secretion system major pseudopilin GspG [Phenylobacterium sp.]|nr:type II secretion system major pseudopilin GspG [Phenylobacterium sp.]